jgi:MSHA pilin protein MshC
MQKRFPQSGFTLVELVTVIVIIGIIAVVAAPKFFSAQGFSERGYFDEVASALRYAQKLSVATQCLVQVNIAANRYDLFFPNDTDADPTTCDVSPAVYGASPVRSPAGQDNFARAAPNGVVIGNLVVVFDAEGRPSAGGMVAIGGRTLFVEAETGYVHD